MTAPSTTPATVTVGQYLATRLGQLGATHVFGLPGDYNLSLLDEMLTVPTFHWVGSTNELNAAYAADGFARISRRIGALVTTYGVGELSAINGVAGSFAEDVPVIQITGAPRTAVAAAGAKVHHTLIDGDYGHFSRAYDEVTTASATLRRQNAGQEIDRVLVAALEASKPGYLSIPADVAVARIPAGSLATPLRPRRSDPDSLAAFEADLRVALAGATDLTVLAGPRVHRKNLESSIRSLAEVSGVRIASQAGSRAIIDESHRSSLGMYNGAMTKTPGTREAVDGATPLVLAGVVMSDFLTGFFSHGFDPDDSIDLDFTTARIRGASYYGVTMADSLAAVERVARELALEAAPNAEVVSGVPRVEGQDPLSPLSQDAFWAEIQAWLPRDTLAIAEAGTPFYGALELSMPDGSDLLGQPVWSSIGFTLPAMLGAAIAAPDKRAVLFIGDGSAQLTIQELGTVLQRGLAPIVFLVNNEGYTVERAIQSPDAPYQDIATWNWTAIPATLAPNVPSETVTVRTVAELRGALALASSVTERLVFVEVIVPRDDKPSLLVELARGLTAADEA
ncbi:Alpha-keto-acid decarboxylase [Frondihabitans sp. 762G35]|uniref:alpha-keto acid decarboxylase family protein n=1 Tax=Frondihabitans sp. 762G35 TaxID=1446794 RepID=UPI000D200352|nr:thiamine pyrophosphate-binding protein [Frondihabitans sp. 762G35]ARC57880.1 Alpha-keto-acid decarboxylase [Frondihabitans sp. 762G35]